MVVWLQDDVGAACNRRCALTAVQALASEVHGDQ